MVIADSNLQLLNITYNIVEDKTDTTLFFNFFFTRKCQFYTIGKDENSMVISFVNAKFGGFLVEDSVVQINKGPIISLQIKQRIEDKNKEIRGLKPEYYYVADVVLKFSRMPLSEDVLKFSETDNIISMYLPWPISDSERNALYNRPQKKKRKGLIAAMAGIGAAGLAGNSTSFHALSEKGSRCAIAGKPARTSG